MAARSTTGAIMVCLAVNLSVCLRLRLLLRVCVNMVGSKCRFEFAKLLILALSQGKSIRPRGKSDWFVTFDDTRIVCPTRRK